MRKGKIDIVVGLQFGDEGKGATCVMLEQAFREYSFSVRVGSSTAEHRFRYNDKNYRFRVLPSLAVFSHVDLLLGAGHIIRPDILQREIGNFGIEKSRIFVDKFAAVVSQKARSGSKRNNSQGRGGYAMGTSLALYEKMKRKTDMEAVVEGNRDKFEGMKIGTILEMVNDRLSNEQDGILEGSQGALLSLNHGYYPFVTSYDVTTPALLASAGLHWEQVRDVYGVLRTSPMRVAGDSGIMAGGSLTWGDIEQWAGHPIPDSRKRQSNEDDTFAGYERVAKFHQGEFRRALLLNRPTKLVLTHADWYPEEKLDTLINIIEYTARETLGRDCPVVFVRFGENTSNYRIT